MKRRRARRRRDECVLDLARPDENWWLGFATDAAPTPVGRAVRAPGARSLPAIGRGLIPLDDAAARLVMSSRRAARPAAERCRPPCAVRPRPGRRPRGRGGRGSKVREPARAHQGLAGLYRGGRAERRADPAARRRGPPAPSAARTGGERAGRRRGGATLDSWALIDGHLGGWISAAARRCVAALKDGRPAPPAVLNARSSTTRTRSCSRLATTAICPSGSWS